MKENFGPIVRSSKQPVHDAWQQSRRKRNAKTKCENEMQKHLSSDILGTRALRNHNLSFKLEASHIARHCATHTVKQVA